MFPLYSPLLPPALFSHYKQREKHSNLGHKQTMSQLFLWNTSEEHTHLHPQQSPGSWEVKAKHKAISRLHSVMLLPLWCHPRTGHTIFYLIRTKAVGINIVHQTAHGWCTNSNTRTHIAIIKLSPTQQSAYSMDTVDLWQRHQPIWQAQGTLIFNPHSAQPTPVTCHFRLLKLLQPRSCLDKIEADIPTKQPMASSPLGFPVAHWAHTHSWPLWSRVRWSEQGSFLHGTAASASTVSRGCRQALEFLKAARPSSAAPAHPVCFGNELYQSSSTLQSHSKARSSTHSSISPS